MAMSASKQHNRCLTFSLGMAKPKAQDNKCALTKILRAEQLDRLELLRKFLMACSSIQCTLCLCAFPYITAHELISAKKPIFFSGSHLRWAETQDCPAEVQLMLFGACVP